MGIIKMWDAISGVFFLMTGVYIADALVVVASYSIGELLTIDKIGSLVVSVVVCFFWLSRYFLIKRKSKQEEKLLNLEIEIKEICIKERNEELCKKAKNDNTD